MFEKIHDGSIYFAMAGALLDGPPPCLDTL